jgi:MraZ protein
VFYKCFTSVSKPSISGKKQTDYVPPYFINGHQIMTELDEFLGNTPIVFDEKGRFNVPASIKSVLETKYNANLIIYINGDHILITPKIVWDENKKNWEKLDPFDVDNIKKQKRRRKILSKAKSCQMKSGKILIPANQREAVGLGKDAILIGMSDTFEVWSKEQWAKEDGA